MDDTTKRLGFFEVFQETATGALEPKRRVSISGVEFGPGVLFQKGVAYGGVDFHLFRGSDIAGKEGDDGVLEIVGVYKAPAHD